MSSPLIKEKSMEMVNIKVGDIIDGRKVTKIFELCGGIAYQSEPVSEKVVKEPEIDMNPPEITEEAEVSEERPRRGRRRKEA